MRLGAFIDEIQNMRKGDKKDEILLCSSKRSYFFKIECIRTEDILGFEEK